MLSTILSRIGELLREKLDTDQFSRVKFSFHVFPTTGTRRMLIVPAIRPSIPT